MNRPPPPHPPGRFPPARISPGLRQSLAALLRPTAPARSGGLCLGDAALDTRLGGGLARGALHECFAATPADGPAATGFATLLAIRASAANTKRLLWVRQDGLEPQAGRPHPPGLAALGLDPARLVLLRAPDAAASLRAAVDALSCTGLAAVLLELHATPAALDLTATRRLSLAAEGSGVPILMPRAASPPTPSTAASRWSIAALPSQPLPANAPGPPAFAATLLRLRGGIPGPTWNLEWNHAQRCFHTRPAPHPGTLAPLPAHRAPGPDHRLAG